MGILLLLRKSRIRTYLQDKTSIPKIRHNAYLFLDDVTSHNDMTTPGYVRNTDHPIFITRHNLFWDIDIYHAAI